MTINYFSVLLWFTACFITEKTTMIFIGASEGSHCIHCLRYDIKIVNNGGTNETRILSRWDAARHVDVDKKSSCRKIIYPREHFSCFSRRKSSGNPHSSRTISIILNDCVQAQVLADCVLGTNINKTSDRDWGSRLSGWFRSVVYLLFRTWVDAILSLFWVGSLSERLRHTLGNLQSWPPEVYLFSILRAFVLRNLFSRLSISHSTDLR